jgi:hypothetical protein
MLPNIRAAADSRDGSMVSESADFMTVAEVASILKLNQQTVRNWI